MKNLYKFVMIAASAAIALASCTQEVEQPIENEIATVSSHIEFTAEVADPATRATLTTEDEKSFKAAWKGTDKVSLYALSDTFEETAEATWNETDKCFEGNFTKTVPTVKEDWEYEAKYPYSADGNIPFGAQRVQKGNAYNSAYDIMYGTVGYSNAVLGKDDNNNTFVIPMTRLTGIAYFHIKGGPDEDVVSATLEATGIAAETVTIASNGASVTPNTTLNSITITFEEGTAPQASDLQLWFNVLPGSYSGLKLTINTATKTAVLNSTKELTYTAGKLNKALLSNLNWNEGDKHYIKVTSNDDLTDGKYLIVYENGSVAFDGGRETLDAVSNIIDVQITDGQILADEITDAAYFEIVSTQSGSTIKSASGYFIGIDSYSNGLSADKTNERRNNISIDNDGNANITVPISESNIMSLRYNKASNQTRFRYFKSGQEAIALYRYNGEYIVKKSAELSFNETEFAAKVGEIFTAPTLVNPYNVPVTWSSSDNDIATVAQDGTVTIGTKTGTVTITAFFEGNDTYNQGSALYTISVTAATRTLASITKPETGITIEGVTAVAVSGNNVVIRDDSGLFLLYKSSHGLKVGDHFDLIGDVTFYESNNILEFTDNITISNKSTGTIEHGSVVEFDTIAEDLKTNTKVTYVHAKGLQDGQNITTLANNALYLSAANSATNGKQIDIKGYIIGYSSSHANCTIVATDLDIDPDFAELTVDVDEISWLYNETDTKVVNATVNANGGFTYTTTNMGWATVVVDGNVISVTPNGQNNNSTPNNGTIILTHNADNTKTVEIACEQGEFVNLVSAKATFTPAASGGMATVAGEQTGIRRNVTATISNGILSEAHIGIYKNAILTLTVPAGAKITKIEFTCTSEYPISGFADIEGLVKDGNNGVWTGSAESVSFTASEKQVRVTAIVVTYSIEEDQLIKYAPTINASDKAVYIGESVSLDATSDSEGAISYSIVSGGDYISLNATTGSVTGLAEGTAIVTVSVAANGDYDAGSKDINVTVTKKPEIPDPEEIVMSTLGFSNSEKVSSITGDNFVLSFADGSNATAYYNTGTGVRIYGGGSVTVTATNNYKIDKIEFTYSGSNYAPTDSDYAVGSGSLTTGVNSTWTGTATTSVTVSRNSGSGHWRLQKVKVTFTK